MRNRIALILVSFAMISAADRLIWSPSAGATEYIVKRRSASGTTIEFPPVRDTTFALLNVDKGSYFSVSASNGRKRSPFSNEVLYRRDSRDSAAVAIATVVAKFKVRYKDFGQRVNVEFSPVDSVDWKVADFVSHHDTVEVNLPPTAQRLRLRFRLQYNEFYGQWFYEPHTFVSIPLQIDSVELL